MFQPRIFSPLDLIRGRFEHESKRIQSLCCQDKIILREDVCVNLGPMRLITFINAEDKINNMIQKHLYKRSFFIGDLRIEKLEILFIEYINIKRTFNG